MKSCSESFPATCIVLFENLIKGCTTPGRLRFEHDLSIVAGTNSYRRIDRVRFLPESPQESEEPSRRDSFFSSSVSELGLLSPCY